MENISETAPSGGDVKPGNAAKTLSKSNKTIRKSFLPKPVEKEKSTCILTDKENTSKVPDKKTLTISQYRALPQPLMRSNTTMSQASGNATPRSLTTSSSRPKSAKEPSSSTTTSASQPTPKRRQSLSLSETTTSGSRPTSLIPRSNTFVFRPASKRTLSLFKQKKANKLTGSPCGTAETKNKEEPDSTITNSKKQEDCIQEEELKPTKPSFLQLKTEFLEKKKMLLDVFKNLKDAAENKEYDSKDDIDELKKLERFAAFLKLYQKRFYMTQDTDFLESGAGEIPQEDDFIEDPSEVITDISLNIRTIPKSPSEVIYDGLSKLTDISQNNFVKVFNKIKKSLSIEDGEELNDKLNILETQHVETLSSLMSDIRHLVQEKNKLLDDNHRLSVTQDKYHEDLQSQIDLLEVENSKLTNQLKDTVEEFARDKKKLIEDYESSKIDDQIVLDMRRTLIANKADLSAQVKKINELETLVDVLEIELKQQKEKVSKTQNLEQEVEKLNDELQRIQGEYSLLEENNNLLKCKTLELEEKLEEEMAEKSELKTVFENNVKEKVEELKKIIKQEKTNEYQMLKNQNAPEECGSQDEQIDVLSRKIEELTNELEKMKEHLLFETTKKKQYHEEAKNLRIEIANMHYAQRDIIKEREEVEKMVVEKTLELEQRDHILLTQTRAQFLKENFIDALKAKDKEKEECVGELASAYKAENVDEVLFKKISDSNISSELDEEIQVGFKHDRMTEMYTLLEKKHILLKDLERRFNEVQGVHEKAEKERVKYEARITQLEKVLMKNNIEYPRENIPICVQ
uniref:Uncharacterized protein n=2 Tax=Clastoptera arizonana TaxID=38151 RepID=A0A1B6C2V9_9HEMI